MCLTWLNISLEADRRVNQERRDYGLSAYKSLEDVGTVEERGFISQGTRSKEWDQNFKSKDKLSALRSVF